MQNNHLRPIDQLDIQKTDLIAKIKTLQARQSELKATNHQRIPVLRKEADRLATIFKPLLQQSQEAYAAGDGASAKELSIQGREIEAQCKALNAQANALRDELITLPDTIATTKRTLAELEVNLARLEPMRHIAIIGFEQARGVNVHIVNEELAPLAPRLLRHIKGVAYVHSVQRDLAVGRTGNKADNPEQTPITLYPSLSSFDLKDLEKEYRDTIIHEAGHVLFDWVIITERRLAWGRLYDETRRSGGRFINDYARENKREDFGECFHTYIHEPEILRKLDPQRYTLIDTIYKEINK